ncbi:hypothetical protein Trisim1_000797 [Trichoderma cf. simile WF8]
MSNPIKYFNTNAATRLNADDPSKNAGLTLAYRTFGSPKNPAVLIPSCFSGRVASTLSFLYEAPNAVLKDYFVIVCGLLGGSDSSSPSNGPTSVRGSNFPDVSYETNIRLQRALCDALGITQLEGYIGYSMGGQQAYYMAVLYPSFVKHVVILGSSARTSWQNKSCLGGAMTALLNSSDWQDGLYDRPAHKGTRSFARAYATWALSANWFRQERWNDLGHSTLEEYLVKNWDEGMGAWDAHDLLCMLVCWLAGDITLLNSESSFSSALASIEAKVLLMPCRSDLFFPPEDNEEELKHLRHGEIKVIESIWGHMAAGEWAQKEDQRFIESSVQQFLSS